MVTFMNPGEFMEFYETPWEGEALGGYRRPIRRLWGFMEVHEKPQESKRVYKVIMKNETVLSQN